MYSLPGSKDSTVFVEAVEELTDEVAEDEALLLADVVLVEVALTEEAAEDEALLVVEEELVDEHAVIAIISTIIAMMTPKTKTSRRF